LNDLDRWFSNVRNQFGRKNKRSTVNDMHKRLKAALEYAVEEELLPANPYRKFKAKVEDFGVNIKYLTEDQLERIKKHNLGGNQSLEKARDWFLMGCSTGLRYSDLKELAPGHFTYDKANKRYFIHKKQAKNGKLVTIPVFGIGKEIYLKYRDGDIAKILDKLLPPLSNSKLNLYLKVIQDITGIKDVNLTSHVARHTCATYLLNKGVPPVQVMEILGHSTLRMTLHYAKITKKSLAETADRLEGEGDG